MLAVLAVILAIEVGGGVAAVSAINAHPAHGVEAGHSVVVRVAKGWAKAGTLSGDFQGIRLTNGSANLDVLATDATLEPDPRALFDRYVQDALRPDSRQLRLGPVEPITIDGHDAIRGSYVGFLRNYPSPIEGEMTVWVSPLGTGAVFDGWAPEGQLGSALDDIHLMESAAEVP